ncbi:hypothetical protein [Marinitoga sp. 1197]|uniref:hypothetical protein n=1 Tax=Marinitoga sp. 1197 TaxID=1428449 RepID=UPI0012E07B26|nr:hypothetical protein [Marinitoga sp. 1197]
MEENLFSRQYESIVNNIILEILKDTILNHERRWIKLLKGYYSISKTPIIASECYFCQGAIVVCAITW